jgi:serine/threonine protein kinase/Tol biopolymer transport system component
MANGHNQQFAGYEVLSTLGRGGTGIVFKVRDRSLDRIVALKVLAADLAADPAYLARFKHAAIAAANQSHPNLVQVYQAGESEGVHYIAMEFVEGESLQQRLDRTGRLEAAEAMAVCMYAAQALECAWQRTPVIHGGIKPGNIFLTHDGMVKVGDLGLSEPMGRASAGATTIPKEGVPHYINPEQALGRDDLDFRSDVYSLGCVLYRMLSGKTPYEGDDARTVLSCHIHNPPPDLTKEWPDCPESLRALLRRMLAKAPNERHSSHAELIAELERVNRDLAEDGASPDAAGPPGAGWRQRAKHFAVVAISAAAVLACLLVWAHPDALKKKHSSVSPQPVLLQTEKPSDTSKPEVAPPQVADLKRVENVVLPPRIVDQKTAEEAVTPPPAMDQKSTEEILIPPDVTRRAGEFCRESAFVPYECPPRSFINRIASAPDGKTILFSLSRRERRIPYTGDTVWIVEMESMRATPHLLQKVQHPAFSPNGDPVIFSRLGPETGFIRIEAATQQQQVLPGFFSWWPAFTRDGRRLCFMSYGSEGAAIPDLWIARADGSDPRRLTQNQKHWTNIPEPSPVEDVVAYRADETKGIWVQHLDTGAVLLKTRLDQTLSCIQWSPDGRVLLYRDTSGVWGMGRRGKAKLRIMDVAGEPVGRAFAWMRDGRLISYSEEEGRKGFQICDLDIENIRRSLEAAVVPQTGSK